ncbi:MAG: 4-(cytidine 5'-diphospho)-2-C-methyl-D-erythritol kinase, partial [Deltaproteobacteria bacterium]|nr:4-(cytidine 5'-diphospho)-2-C-methyl-D-erythritol kinase [Deltaproteobacteria bacterium]
GSGLPEDQGNIVYRAARAYFSYIGYKKGIAITIGKKIPLAAGLGGGSSNAATTLVTLNEMTGGSCRTEELMKIGKALGADVPFFILGKTAWATGIGDCPQEAGNIPPLWFLLVNPGFPVSTKVVYESLNLTLTTGRINYSIPPFKIGTGKNVCEGLKNDLEAVTMTRHPLLNHLKKLLLSCGASGALMSGSGPTLFGIFETEEQARRGREALTAGGVGKWWIYLAHSI